MNYKPIIILSGEPYSVFLEIFFKTKKIKKFKRPLVLIVSKKLLYLQMKKLGFNFKLNIVNLKTNNLNTLNNKMINIIDVDFDFKNAFEKISNSSNVYIENCFKVALQLLKDKKCIGLINGPISKKKFLKQKFYGITEYLAFKTNNEDFFK